MGMRSSSFVGRHGQTRGGFEEAPPIACSDLNLITVDEAFFRDDAARNCLALAEQLDYVTGIEPGQA